MIICDIKYEYDTEIKQVELLRKVLDKVHSEHFYFSSRTYKWNPIKVEENKG